MRDAARTSVPHLAGSRIVGVIASKYTSTFTENAEIARQTTIALPDPVDVATTSGAGTGIAPAIDKTRAMKRPHTIPLRRRVACSPANVHEYEGLIDVLVASDVETEPYSGVFDLSVLSTMISHCQRA